MLKSIMTIIWIPKKTFRIAILGYILFLPFFGFANSIDQNASLIAEKLLKTFSFGKPVVLDVRCGEWSSSLEKAMRLYLLSNNVDIREILYPEIFSSENQDSTLTQSIEPMKLLSALKLEQAILLQVELEQLIQTKEKTAFLSYSRYKVPVYRFSCKEILLPEQRLIAVTDYKHYDSPVPDQFSSMLALKWYEPVLVLAIIGSLVYMLWTLH